MLEIRGINKNFDAVVALKEAHLSAKAGQIMALLGANGSGKSTLVKVLSGLVNPNSGEISIDNKPVTIRNAADSRRLGVAVAYQDLSLIPAMSAIDNIVLGMEPVGFARLIDKKSLRKKALTYFNMLKIECDPDALVQTLMPSTQSMIEIAKAIATEPKILILDEATASLHSDEVDIVFEVLAELKKKGVAIIIVSHRMGEIFRICDSCTILKSGETVAEGDLSGLNLDEIVFHMTGKYLDKSHKAASDEDITNKELLLDVSNLTMFPKLQGVHFKSYRGEIVGIGGLDGQGQSEFIRALLSDEKYESGEILYKGKKIKYKTPADAIADQMGFISGDRSRESIFPLRSVADNLFAAKATKGKLFSFLSQKTVNDFAKDAMEKYGIVAGSIDHPANSLSGGNQQKLVVGRWIALSPDLLLLDDPTKGVDVGSRREIHNILKDCIAKGMSVIYVSSDNEELLEISDRIYVFYEGKISIELTGGNRTEEKLVAAMLGLSESMAQGE